MAHLVRAAMQTSAGAIVIACSIALGCGGGGSSDGGSSDTSTGSTGTPTTTLSTTTAPSTTMSSSDEVSSADTTMTPSTGSGESSSESGSTDESSESGNVPPCPYEPVDGEPEMNFVSVASGFTGSRVVQVLGDPTQPDRLFVVQQAGYIRVLEPGATEAPEEVLLDITDDVILDNEQGLLSMVLHPDYPEDPRFYVYYAVDPDRRARIAEYTMDPETFAEVPGDSGTTIFEAYNGTGLHYGGMMHFDSEGMLLVGLGDGADDDSVYDTLALHSRFIRIGVETDGTMDNPVICPGCPQFGPFDYTIPDDNPYVDDADFAPEIWAQGFRNPWRWFFHPETQDIYVGDVGNEFWEEVSVVRRGQHYGWQYMEGNHCSSLPSCDLTAGPNEENEEGLTTPLVDYPHDIACAVISGPIYNSCEVPAWQGLYFYGDLCAAGISALRYEGNQLTDLGIVDPSNIAPSGSGTNAWGEVFFTGGMFSDEIFKLVPVR